jgi:hypothetical protein
VFPIFGIKIPRNEGNAAETFPRVSGFSVSSSYPFHGHVDDVSAALAKGIKDDFAVAWDLAFDPAAIAAFELNDKAPSSRRGGANLDPPCQGVGAEGVQIACDALGGSAVQRQIAGQGFHGRHSLAIAMHLSRSMVIPGRPSR